MPSGRLGSAKINPSRASLLYSNASGTPASVSIQATTLSATANTNLALSIDSATIAVNETTVATALTAGSMNQRVRWLDPLSSTNVLRLERTSPGNVSNSTEFPVSYWDGSNFVRPSQPLNLYGSKSFQKIDPYFLTNPSAYGGKTSASGVLMMMYNTSADNIRFRHYNDISSFTGQQFRLAQMYQDPGVTQSYNYDSSYSGFGQAVDYYTDYWMGFGQNGFTQVMYGKTGTPTDTMTSNSIMYNLFNIGSYGGITGSQLWYAPRIMAANGLFLMQSTGSVGNVSTVVVSDVPLAVEQGNIRNSIEYGAHPKSWWYFQLPHYASNGQGLVTWFDYNPTTDRYYMQMVDEVSAVATQNRNIYSFTRADLRAKTFSGASGTISLTNDSMFTNHGRAPWGTTRVERPQRIGENLWWTVTETDVAYVSTDLATWQLATTYFVAQGEAANTFNKFQLTGTSYLYAQTGIADVKKFDSKFSIVSENSVIEYNTSVNNYQRTGLVLSAGDKLYAQNYGSVPLSITAMGFEGS